MEESSYLLFGKRTTHRYRWMGTVHRQICSTFAQLLLKFEAINNVTVLTHMCTLHTVLDRYKCTIHHVSWAQVGLPCRGYRAARFRGQYSMLEIHAPMTSHLFASHYKKTKTKTRGGAFRYLLKILASCLFKMEECSQEQ